MNRELRDGLVIDPSIYIIDEKKPGFPIRARVFQCAAIMLGSWGSIGVLVESVSISVDVSTVYIVLFLCAAITYGLCLIPSFDLVKIFFGVLSYGLYLYSRLPALANGFYIFENHVIDRLAAYYDIPLVWYVAEYSTEVRDSTLLVVMIGIPFVALFTIAIVRNRLAGIAGILLFLPVTVSFVFGLIPSERYLLAYLAAVLYLSRASFSNHNVTDRNQKLLLHRINSRAAILFCVICLLLFCLLKLIISPKDYEGYTRITETKAEIQDFLYSFSINDVTDYVKEINPFNSGSSGGGIDGGRLDTSASIKFKGTEQLVITAPEDAVRNGIYLKGYVGSDYTGKSWEGHSDEARDRYQEVMGAVSAEDFSPVNQLVQYLNESGQIGDNSYYRPNMIHIDYKAASKKYYYLPYYLDYDSLDNAGYIQDLYAYPKKKQDEYTMFFYNSDRVYTNTGLDLYAVPRDFYLKERQYVSFVEAFYYQLPSEGLYRIDAEFGSNNLVGRMSNIYQKIAYVGDYLANNTTYTLSPGSLPEGQDYIEYFLYENRKGYCVHYASAAVMMLRAMGVPARYVEGYTVGPADIVRNTVSKEEEDGTISVSVKDYNAHAWIEVYFDVYGWMPIDVTPSSNIGFAAWEQSGAAAAPTATPTPTPTPTTAPATPTPLPDNQQQNEPTPNLPKPTQTPEEAVAQKEQLDAFFLVFFFLLLALAGIAFTCVLFMKKKKQKVYRNRNKETIRCYAGIERLLVACRQLGKRNTCLQDRENYVLENCRLMDTDEFTRCMEIVKKARFSKNKVTKEELKEVKDFYRKLWDRTYPELNAGQKLNLKISNLFQAS